jgi:hypothetical protein
MRRRITLALVGAALMMTQVALGEPAGAARLIPKSKPPTVTGHGNVSCAVGGSLKYQPAIKPAAGPTSVSVKAKLSCSLGNTGNARVRITGGKLVASSASYTGSCATPNPTSLSGSITWKAVGGKVRPTTFAFGAATGGSVLIAHKFTSGLVGGSYAGERATATFNSLVSKQACGPKGIKGWPLAASTLTINVVGCDKNVPTTWFPGQFNDPSRPDDGHIWFLVLPAYPYTAQCHPTGTLTWSYDGENTLPQCAGSKPIVDSGDNQRYVPPFGIVRNPGNYWGVDSGINLAAGEECVGQSHLHYSGDSVYRPFTF